MVHLLFEMTGKVLQYNSSVVTLSPCTYTYNTAGGESLVNISPTSGPASAHCERINRRIIGLQQKTTRSLFMTRVRIRMREGPDVWLNLRFQKKRLRHGHAPGIKITSFSLPGLMPPTWSVMYIRGWMIKQ